MAPRFQPDLIVGASVGSLNGYAIACGATPEALREMWLDKDLATIERLEDNLQKLVDGNRPRIDYAVVVTDLLRLKPVIYRGDAVTWRHLAASCAVPLVLPQVRIDGRYCSDGGLLNPLPVYAAVDLGATEILGLHCLPEIPSRVLRPLRRAFRAVFGVNPPLPAGVNLTVIEPERCLGSLSDAIRFNPATSNAGSNRAIGMLRAIAMLRISVPKKHFPNILVCAIMVPIHMPAYRIHRLKDHLRQSFRHAAHVSGAASVKPRDYAPGDSDSCRHPVCRVLRAARKRQPPRTGRSAGIRIRRPADLQVHRA